MHCLPPESQSWPQILWSNKTQVCAILFPTPIFVACFLFWKIQSSKDRKQTCKHANSLISLTHPPKTLKNGATIIPIRAGPDPEVPFQDRWGAKTTHLLNQPEIRPPAHQGWEGFGFYLNGLGALAVWTLTLTKCLVQERWTLKAKRTKIRPIPYLTVLIYIMRLTLWDIYEYHMGLPAIQFLT